jgi:ATP-dependent Clp protease adapter protein ClpS
MDGFTGSLEEADRLRKELNKIKTTDKDYKSKSYQVSLAQMMNDARTMMAGVSELQQEVLQQTQKLRNPPYNSDSNSRPSTNQQVRQPSTILPHPVNKAPLNANQYPRPQQGNLYNQYSSNNRSSICFGCGRDDGHVMSRCPALMELSMQGYPVYYDVEARKWLDRNSGTMVNKRPSENLRDAIVRVYQTPRKEDAQGRVNYARLEQDEYPRDQEFYRRNNQGEFKYVRADPISTGNPEDFDEYESDPDDFSSYSEDDEVDWEADSSDLEDDENLSSQRQTFKEESDDEDMYSNSSDYNAGRAFLTQDTRAYAAERSQTSIRDSRNDSSKKVVGADFRNKRAEDAKKEAMPIVERQKYNKAQAEIRDQARSQRRGVRESQQDEEEKKHKEQSRKTGYQPSQRSTSAPPPTTPVSTPRHVSQSPPATAPTPSRNYNREKSVERNELYRDVSKRDAYKPIPIDARQPRKVLSDVSWNKDQEKRVKAVHNTSNSAVSKPKRINELTALINEDTLMNKILDMEVPVTVGNILGISKGLRQNLNGRMKDQNAPNTVEPDEARVHYLSSDPINPEEFEENLSIQPVKSYARTVRNKQLGYVPLLEFTVRWNNKPIRAIIDTGSEMNIISKEVVEEIQPTEPRTLDFKVSMVDANNGRTRMESHYSDICLTIGQKETYADLYVMPKAKFGLILGRPWQSENLVTIDERKNGTWLVLKNDLGEVSMEVPLGPSDTFIPFKQSSLLVRASEEDETDHDSNDSSIIEEPLTPEESWLDEYKDNRTDALDRCHQALIYTFRKYIHGRHEFDVFEIPKDEGRDLIAYIIFTWGTLHDAWELLPEKYLYMNPKERYISLKEDWSKFMQGPQFRSMFPDGNVPPREPLKDLDKEYHYVKITDGFPNSIHKTITSEDLRKRSTGNKIISKAMM